MLSFSKEFFRGEVRSDYYVRPLVKRQWAALMEVLAEIDRVCKKYGITYFADFGTLLGAVRHQGFIPWDDDIDLAMRREDYLRFQQIAPLEFNYFEARPDAPEIDGRMYFHTPHTSRNEFTPQTMIMTGRNIDFTEEYLKRYHGCPFAIAVDICPIDYIPGNNEETAAALDIIASIRSLINYNENWIDGGKPANKAVRGEIERLGSLVGYRFKGSTGIRRQAAALMDHLSAMYGRDESEYMQNMFWYAPAVDRYRLYEKAWYDDVTYLPFETMQIPCPAEPEKVLEAVFGDYMTPVNYGGHGGDQLRILGQLDLFGGADPAESLEEMMEDYI